MLLCCQVVQQHPAVLEALEILQHQEGLGLLFHQANQGVPSPPCCPVSQEILVVLGDPWDQACSHRVLCFLFLLSSLFLLEDPFFPLFLEVQGTQQYIVSHLILGVPAVLVLQEGRVILAALVSLELSQVSQEHQVPLEVLADQETQVGQEVPSCLHWIPQACLVDLVDRVVQWPPFLHSDQGSLDPLEDL